MIKYLAIAATALMLLGCNNPRPVEYVYIDKNCTNVEELITKPVDVKVRWLAIDINGTRYYATQDGMSLVMQIGE